MPMVQGERKQTLYFLWKRGKVHKTDLIYIIDHY